MLQWLIRRDTWIGGTGFIILFGFAVISQPLALLIFPVCTGLVIAVLRINKNKIEKPILLLIHAIPVRRLLYLLIIPGIVTAMYALAESAGYPMLEEAAMEGAPLAATPLIYLITMIAGFGMWFYSSWKVR